MLFIQETIFLTHLYISDITASFSGGPAQKEEKEAGEKKNEIEKFSDDYFEFSAAFRLFLGQASLLRRAAQE
jgi:hypothetical protein